MAGKIIVTGSTGNLGSRTLQHLLTLVPPTQIITSVFNPNSTKHDELKKKGVEVRKGDFNDPASLVEAFKGADKLFLVSVPSLKIEERFAAHKSAIDAAKVAGIKHVYYTSLAIKSGSTADVFQAHLKTEAYLKASGLTYTIIREGIYYDTYPVFLGYFQPTDTEVAVPGNGGVSFVSYQDLAIANAKILASNDYKNEIIYLTGPQILDMETATAILAKVLGHPIKFLKVSLQEFLDRNASKVLARTWSTAYVPLDNGDWAIDDPLLAKLVGKPLTTFEDFVKDSLNTKSEENSDLNLHYNYNQ